MRRLGWWVGYLWAVLALVACGSGSDPRAVAEGFWQAIQERDLERARGYAATGTADNLELNDEGGEVEINLGEAREGEHEVRIDTTMTSTTEGRTRTLPMQTILVREDGAWKVDVDRTMYSILGGAMGEMMKSMGEGLGQMGRAMGEAMQQGMQDLGESLHQDLDEMGESMRRDMATPAGPGAGRDD